METKIIELIKVSKSYGSEGRAFLALSNFTAQFQKGSFNVILGASGSGKTTLLKLLSGLIKPSSGQVIFEDSTMNSLNFSQLAALRRKYFGFVFQDAGLLEHLTALENIQFPELGKMSSGAKDLSEYFGVSQTLEKYPAQMSLGERQRIAIARAIYRKPQILIADEPTANLDWENSKRTIELLKKYSEQGMTVFIATHDERVLDFSDQAVRLEKGVMII
jgi:ABC-type lipoprotein export system ATPase subunit